MQIIKRIFRFIRGRKRGRIALWIILSLFIISLLAPFIANDIPLVCSSKNGIEFPVLSKLWNGSSQYSDACTWTVKPLIPYSQKSIDIQNGRFASPLEEQVVSSLRYRHWLGTDALGRDSLAGLLYGSGIALRIGLFAALIAFLIGIFIGTASGYFGNNSLKLNFVQLIILFLCVLLLGYQLSFGFFFGYEKDSMWEVGASIIILLSGTIGFSKTQNLLQQNIRFPLDNIVLWIFEVYKSIPNIFFILVLLSIFAKPGITSLVLTIAFVIWPIIGRYTRAEILKLKEEDFIKSAETSGASSWNIITKHLLLNAIGPALVSFAFSFSAAILLEASLSFLGLGLAVEEVSWGSMLSEVKNNYRAWWLALFPGLAIFLVISALNYIGELIGEYFDQN